MLGRRREQVYDTESLEKDAVSIVAERNEKIKILREGIARLYEARTRIKEKSEELLRKRNFLQSRINSILRNVKVYDSDAYEQFIENSDFETIKEELLIVDGEIKKHNENIAELATDEEIQQLEMSVEALANTVTNEHHALDQDLSTLKELDKNVTKIENDLDNDINKGREKLKYDIDELVSTRTEQLQLQNVASRTLDIADNLDSNQKEVFLSNLIPYYKEIAEKHKLGKLEREHLQELEEQARLQDESIRAERDLRVMKDLHLPSEYYECGYLDLSHIRTPGAVKLPRKFKGNIDLDGLRSAGELQLPKELHGDLYIRNLVSAEGVKFPEEIYGDIYLDGLTSTKGLELPRSHIGNLRLPSLQLAIGLGHESRQFIGNLDLRNLTSAEGLRLTGKFSTYEHINLRSLKSTKGLVLPNTSYNSNRLEIDLTGLETLEGLDLPHDFNGGIILNSELVDKSRILLKNTYPKIRISAQ